MPSHMAFTLPWRSSARTLKPPQISVSNPRHVGSPRPADDWRDWRSAWRSLMPAAFAITMAIIAVPLALLYLTPLVLGLFAPPLDPAHRPLCRQPAAGLHLPGCGRQRCRPSRRHCRRAAEAGRDAGLSARRLHRHGGPALLFPQRHRSAGPGPRPAAGPARPPLGGGRLHHQPADRQDRLHPAAAHHVAQADRADRRGGAGKVAEQAADPASSISTASIWAAAPMAWMARRGSISAPRRAI